MYILVERQTNYIIDRLSKIELEAGINIKLGDNTAIPANMVDIVEVENIPTDAKYYRDGVFTEYNPIEREILIKSYRSKVEELVKQKYSTGAELAIIRKITAFPGNEQYKQEFHDYNEFVESIKSLVKQELGI